MIEFDEFYCFKVGSYIFKIFLYFVIRGIKCVLVGVWGEGVLIGVCCFLLVVIFGGMRVIDL